jgi:hypothetical protein
MLSTGGNLRLKMSEKLRGRENSVGVDLNELEKGGTWQTSSIFIGLDNPLTLIRVENI